MDSLLGEHDRRVIERVYKRLYNGDRLSYDERRDLAAQLEGVVLRLVPSEPESDPHGE